MSDPVYTSQLKFQDIFPSSKPDPSIPTPYANSLFVDNYNKMQNNIRGGSQLEITEVKSRDEPSLRVQLGDKYSSSNVHSSDQVASSNQSSPPTKLSKRQQAEAKRRELASQKHSVPSDIDQQYNNAHSQQSAYDQVGDPSNASSDFVVPPPFEFDAEHDSLGKRLLELRNKRLEKERKMFEEWARVGGN